MLPLSLSASVGSGLDNDEDDVKAMAANLSWLGYPEADPAAETGQWDNGVEGGLRQYQRDRGLTIDGRQTVVRMGGTSDQIRQEGPGKWAYAGVDGTRLFYRRAVEGKKATNEIHIDRVGDKPANIKIRYDD